MMEVVRSVNVAVHKHPGFYLFSELAESYTEMCSFS
jgi:hypothetical protein